MKKVIVGVISGIVGLAGGIAISNKRIDALKKRIKMQSRYKKYGSEELLKCEEFLKYDEILGSTIKDPISFEKHMSRMADGYNNTVRRLSQKKSRPKKKDTLKQEYYTWEDTF